MTGRDLRSALFDLGEDARVPDLLDRTLATARRIRRRRVAAGAAGTAAVIVLVTIAIAAVRPPGTAVAPPATGSSTPAVASTSQSPATTTAPTASGAVPPGTPGPLEGTVYYLAYTDGHTSIYSVTGGGTPKLEVAELSHSVAISPDATMMAWIDGVADGDPAATVMVSDLDGGNRRAVADAQDSGGLCNYPAWSPDSRRVLFQPGGGYDVAWATVDVISGQRTTLEPTGGCYPTWSPDGGTIGWYDRVGRGEGGILTDARGRNIRVIPPVDGVREPCRSSVPALAPGGRLAVVRRPDPDHMSCGDGPGRTARRGVVIDPSTGRSKELPVEGGLSSAIFLPDGSLVSVLESTGELILLDADLKLVARSPAPSGRELVLLAYVP